MTNPRSGKQEEVSVKKAAKVVFVIISSMMLTRAAMLRFLAATVVVILAIASGAIHAGLKTRPRVAVASALVGAWSAPFDLGVIPIHSVLLATGKVLLFYYPSAAVGSEARLWDPATGNMTGITNVSLSRPRDIFCSAHTHLADGRLFISAGHEYKDPGETPTSENDFFDPAAGTFSKGPPLITGRWYPTSVELADGRVLVFGGECLTVESYDPSSNTITQLPASATKYLGFYPRLHLLPTGKIVFSNLRVTELFDPATNTWTVAGTTKFGTRSDSGISILLPGLTKLLRFGGRGAGGSTATAEIIDFADPVPTWRYTGSMNRKRQWLNGVLLPDGKVLALGGGTFGNFGGPVREAEIYDPATETWTLMATQAAPRIYHSTAVLLPDGRVLSAGQNSSSSYQKMGEIYSPPYLFKGPRPTIATAPSSVRYGEAFTVSTPDASMIDRVALIRPDSVTHSINFDQRYVLLTFTATDGATLSVTSPPTGNHAPPGWYMLFILSNGIPSVASWVYVSSTGSLPPPPPPPPPDTTPPAITLTAPADGSSIIDTRPTFSGMAGTAAGDSRIVRVKVYAGVGTGGTLVQTLTVARACEAPYSVEATSPLELGTVTAQADELQHGEHVHHRRARVRQRVAGGRTGLPRGQQLIEATSLLAPGTYTAQAEQPDVAGNIGFSTANTFTITTSTPDTTPPAVALAAPVNGSSTSDTTPLFSGSAGTAPGDLTTVTVRVFAGTGAGGTILQTLTATRASDGSYSVEATSLLALGTYTAQAEQTDIAGNTGLSTANTFTIVEPPPLPPYTSAVMSDAPHAYWRLGEASGMTAADEMGVAPGVYQNGVTLGAPGAIAGDANTAARLDGANDQVSMGDPASGSLDFGTGDFTVEVWVKTLVNREQAVISKQGSGPYWQVTVTDDSGHVGQIRARFFDGAVTLQAYGPAVRVDDGTWRHVVVVFDRDTGITIYVDGVARATAGPMPGNVSNTAALLVGKAPGYLYFSGDLDEVVVYARALPLARVQAHFAAGRGS